jgi:uncharacterized protein YegL
MVSTLDFGSTDVRRLPVYLVIGCGSSMAGEPIRLVEQGLFSLVTELRTQPQAVEQVYISLITFASESIHYPLRSVVDFTIPDLVAGGGYSLGKGLRALFEASHAEIVPNSAERKGDYRPLVFLIFDNEPDDSWEQELFTLEKSRKEKRLGNLIAIGLGKRVNLSVLRQVTESVLWLPEMSPEPLRAFFHWSGASVTTVSQSVSLFPSDAVVPLPSTPTGSKIIL